MTSASDRTDDRIIVSPAEDDEDVADAQVIHGSIVHDDEQDEAGPDNERAGYEPLHAGQTGDGETGDEAGDEPPWRMRSVDEQTPDEPALGGEPRRAWIPEAPAPGADGSGQPIAARSVPAQRAPFEAEPAEPDESDESDEPDEPDADESSAELPEPGQTLPAQSVLGQTTASQSVPGQPATDSTDQAELDEPDLDEPDLDEPDLDELEPIEPVSSQPVSSQSASNGLAAGLTEPGQPAPASDSPWPGIQSMFVDDPRRAVEQAAQVTSTALADLITAAKEIERTLGSDWKPERTGTEELRVALRGYRDLGARIATLTREFQRS
jgi:hypothetical protein